MKTTYHGVIALHLDSAAALCHARGALVDLRGKADAADLSAHPAFSTEVELDAHLVATWATYDGGVVANPRSRSRPLPADREAGEELVQLYRHVLHRVKDAAPAFFDTAEDDVTWAIVWPRPLPASIETLLAHRWAFWAAAEALAEDGYRLLALDAVVCEIRGRLATARATKGASREPGPLSAAALDVAVRWLRAHTEVTFLEHQLLPNPVKRPRDLGFLGLFATGALVEALRDTAEWAEGVWESAVMDEAWVRRRGAASPYRIERGLTRFTAHRSIAVAREQAVAEWKSELPDRLLEDTCDAVAAYLKLKTGVELPVEELMHHARDNSPGGTAYRLGEELPARLGFALAATVHDLPWPSPCVENDDELEAESRQPWVSPWDDDLDRALDTYTETLRTLFVGCGQETMESLGGAIAQSALLCLRSHCEREAGVPGFSNPQGTSAVWVGGSQTEHPW